MDQRIRALPEVRAAEEFAALERRKQQRVTVVTEVWQREKVVRQREKVVQQQKPQPVVRELEDDWFILLDKGARKTGIL